ncbi:MAG: hypothetical protein J5806_05845 [Lentisphaeria bacterium]|nr:hypothetical protein [Lentisphaeria bacterium]
MKGSIRSMAVILALMISAAVYAGPTPRATVQSFLIAARAGNVEGVKRCMKDGEKLGNGDAAAVTLLRLMFQGARITRVEEVNWFHAVVYVKITNPLTGESEDYPISVRKINGDWKICDSK